MTTDTKAVARWDYTMSGALGPDANGPYVLFTDHERELFELTECLLGGARERISAITQDNETLRTALAASRDEVEGLRAEVGKSIQWECLIAWLIENCEGETISEEFLTEELAKMISDAVQTRGNV
jgi:hypothetical protein